MSAQELIVVPRARSTGYEASIVIPGEANARVEWRTNLDALPGAADDLLLPLALLPAMRIGFDLRIEAEISARLLDSVESLQRLYWSWDRSLRLVDVHAERTVRPSTGQRAGAFFSGGVDSFHTAL